MGGDHDHFDYDGKCVYSSKYERFIQAQIDNLREKCQHISACINHLLKSSSAINLIRGQSLALKKTCELVQKDSSGNYTVAYGECSEVERNDIRDDLEKHIKVHLDFGRDTSKTQDRNWRKIKRCYDNHYGEDQKTTLVDDFCSMAQKETTICKDSKDAHGTLEKFFDGQIQDLKCMCEQLNADDHSHLPTSAYVAMGAGGFLLLLLLAICCFCYRKRKKNKKKKSANVIYLPAPNADHSAVYQEVYDDRFPRGGANPPRLPNRYTPHPTSRPPGHEDDPTYLEPIEVGSMYRPGKPMYQTHVSNPGYELPPKYTERPQDSVKDPRTDELTERDVEDHYFQPLPPPPPLPSVRQSPLPSPPPLPPQMPLPTPPPTPQRDSRGSLNSVPPTPQADPTAKAKNPYEDIQDIPDEALSKPLGPVPAKRTKKDDRQTESHYFLLEKEDKGDGEKQET